MGFTHHRDAWVDTDPIDIKDLSNLDHISQKIVKLLRNDVIQLQTENNILNEKLSQKEREIAERYKEMKSQEEEEPTEVTNPTLDEKKPP